MIAKVYINPSRVVVAGPYTHEADAAEKNGGVEVEVDLEAWQAIEANTKAVEENGDIRAATAEEIDAALPIPDSVDSWKLKAILERAGLIPTIEAVIDSLPVAQNIPVKSGWENAPTIHRDNRFVQLLVTIPALGITSAKMDEFFKDTKQFD